MNKEDKEKILEDNKNKIQFITESIKNEIEQNPMFKKTRKKIAILLLIWVLLYVVDRMLILINIKFNIVYYIVFSLFLFIIAGFCMVIYNNGENKIAVIPLLNGLYMYFNSFKLIKVIGIDNVSILVIIPFIVGTINIFIGSFLLFNKNVKRYCDIIKSINKQFK